MKLAVYFPGIGYHCDKPLLYYGKNVAIQYGYTEHINVNYQNHTNIKDLKGNSDNMRMVFENLYEQAESMLKDIDWSKYENILFVSKSIGTIIAAAYAMQHNIVCKNVYYTPLEQTFEFKPQNGIAFTGTADPWVDTDVIVQNCKKFYIPLHIIQNANHSLEAENVWTNLDQLTRIMGNTATFIQS